MARIKYRSAEVQEQRRLYFKKVALISLTVFILIAGGLVFILRMESIQIRENNIQGASIIDKNEIVEVINNSLSGNYFWVIPKSNTFLYSVTKLNNILIERFPGISTLDVGRDGLRKISVKIEERRPETLWCNDVVEGGIPECYFVDSTGKVFARAPFFSGNVYFIFRGTLGKEDPLGAQIFDSQDFPIFQSFVKQISGKLNLSIVGVEIKSDEDFDLILSSGARILLNKNISYENLYNNIDSVIKSQQISSSSIDTIEYVDMRFGNKVYFKSKTVPVLTK